MSQPGQLSHGIPTRAPTAELARRIVELDRALKQSQAALAQAIQGINVTNNQPWTAYTPTWSATTTPPTIGTSVWSAAYLLTGLSMKVRITLVTASGFAVGTGNYTVSLPPGTTPNADIATWDALGTFSTTLAAGGATGHASWGAVYAGSNTVTCIGPTTTANRWTPTAPVTLTNGGDRISFMLQYEIAP